MKIYRFWVTEKQKILIDGIEQVGARYHVNEIIHLHDEITGANFRQPLA